MTRPAAVLALCGLLCAAAPKPAPRTGENGATVRFGSPDGCLIEAFYHAPSSGSYVFINAHGLGSNRHEWGPLEAALKKKGYGYLSIDLSGHGGSRLCSGLPTDHKTFTRERWPGLSADITAAAGFLEGRKIAAGRIVLCGASIGANLSLKAAAEGLRTAGLVLLSPGLNYAGTDAGRYLDAAPDVPVLLAASRDDAYAWESSGYLAAKAGARGLKAVFKAGPGGHGAGMLTPANPELLDYILEWASRLGGSTRTAAPRPSTVRP